MTKYQTFSLEATLGVVTGVYFGDMLGIHQLCAFFDGSDQVGDLGASMLQSRVAAMICNQHTAFRDLDVSGIKDDPHGWFEHQRAIWGNKFTFAQPKGAVQ